MSKVIERAREKISILEAEISRLREFIAVYQSLSVDDSAKFGDSVTSMVTNRSESLAKKTSDRPKRIIEFAKAAIRQRQHPMTRSELVKDLEKQGLVIGGTDKSKNMGTILWRSKQFENVEGQGYWPLEDGDWRNSATGL